VHVSDPCVLFVPVSGSAGSGEVQRCRLLADALRQRWPQAASHFLLADGTPMASFEATFLSSSPTRVPAEVVAAIQRLRPAVVVFDGNARVATLAAARDACAHTVLISSRPSARDRGLRWRRMAQLDAHWLVGAELRTAPGLRERIACWRHRRVQVRRFATVFARPESAAPLLQRFGVSIDQPFAVVCAGGAGHAGAADLFGQAATQLARGGLPTLAIGVRAAAPAIAIDEIPNAQLMGLLAASRVALLAGGSLLVQALALDTPTLALPLQDEQAARVRWLAKAGAVRVAVHRDPRFLAESLRALADDADARAGLRQACRALGLDNGLDAMVEALAELAGLSRNPDRASP
jgi:UDP:flavonoid glycosyltransferase YjiC (YdhE family)